MSLSSYKSRCIEKYKIANPDKDIPCNMGSKWTDKEEMSLLDNIRNNIDIEEIAKKHGRTQGAISARLEVIAIRMYEENRYDTEYIEELTKLNEKTIEEAIYKKNKNRNNYESKNNISNIYITKDDVENMKKDLQKCHEEIKELRELKAIVKNIMDMDSKNKRDEIEDLKKQIQNMLDINNIKNDIIELKKAVVSRNII